MGNKVSGCVMRGERRISVTELKKAIRKGPYGSTTGTRIINYIKRSFAQAKHQGASARAGGRDRARKSRQKSNPKTAT